MQKNRNLKAFWPVLMITLFSLFSGIGSGCDALTAKKDELKDEKKEAAPIPPVPNPVSSGTPAGKTKPAETADPSKTVPAAPGTAQPAVKTLEKAPDLTTDADGFSKATVVLETTKGKIEYKFYPKDAPKTVKRMAELIQSGFYNGLTFHRVVPDFVVQGGDPDGTGMGGSGQKLAAEFNARKHVLGAVAMARSQDPNSADSQFYITLGAIPHLDNQYTVFGMVTSGMDVVKKLAVGDKMTKVSIR